MALAAVALMLGVVVGAAVVAAAGLVPAAHAHEHVATLDIWPPGNHRADYEGIDFSPSGYIAAADHDNHRVDVFHPNGTFAFWFGSNQGRGDMFTWPQDVAFGPDGSIVVADYYDVKVFHPNGTFDYQVGSRGYATDQFHHPRAVAVGPSGHIAVSDSTNRVQIFDSNGRFVHLLLPPSTNAEKNGGVVKMAFSHDGLLAVSMRNGVFMGVQVFHLNGTHVFEVDHTSERQGGFRGADFGPGGLMVETYEYGVGVFYPNGTRVLDFSTWAAGHTRFSGALDVVFGPLGRLAVSDSRHIVVFNTSLTTTTPWRPELPPPAPPAPPPVWHAPAPDVGPAWAPSGASYAFEFGSLGAGVGQFAAVRGIAFGPGGVIAVADGGNHRVQVFHANGTLAFALGEAGLGPGEFYYPDGLAFGPGGVLAVSDMGNSRVQVFRLQ